MQNIKVIPCVGIEVNDRTIALSASRTDVENLLGEPYGTWKNSLYYFQNELRFDFDKDGKIEFIEFLGGCDGKIQPTIYGVSAFQAEADDLYGILSEKNDGEIVDCEHGYSYGFVNISVGVSRSSIPEEVEEMIEEAQKEGEPMDAGEIAYEMGKANHWATIGIGIADYYRKLL